RRRPRRRHRRGGQVRRGDPRQPARARHQGVEAGEGHLRRRRGLVHRRRRPDQHGHPHRRGHAEPVLSMTTTTPAPRTTPTATRPVGVVGGVVALVALSAVSMAIGVADLTWDIFWSSRLPRTLALVLAGAALAVCGLLLQLLVRNRFVEPSTVGTTEA